MAIINGVDFDDVVRDAIRAADAEIREGRDELADIVENIANSLSNDVQFIAKKKASGEFNQMDAQVYLEDQKTLARVRLRSVAIVTLQIAERIWNAIAKVFREAIEKALGWTVL